MKMKFSEKALVKHLHENHGADYTRAQFRRPRNGDPLILLYRPGEAVPDILDVTTPLALAQDMGFRSGSLSASGAFVVA